MKESKVQVATKLHEDGAVSHKMLFEDGSERLVVIGATHPLRNRFVADGSKKGLLARINSAKDTTDAIRKVDELEKKWDKGEWALQAEEKQVKVPDIVRAVAQFKNISIEDAAVAVSKLNKAQQAKVRAIPEVATILATYKLEAGSCEGDAVLASVMRDPEGGTLEGQEAA